MLSVSLFQITVSFDLISSLSYIFVIYQYVIAYVCVCVYNVYMFSFLFFFFVFFLRVHKGQCVKNCNT